MSEGAHTSYDPQAIEARRQHAWREQHAFSTPAVLEDRPHRYIKPSAPFTSGNIHIGHVRSYSIGDAYARFWRARGDDVLFAFGFDAFGLPAELGAIASGEPPSEWVSRCARHMTGQLDRLGFSFDWERTFVSSDPIMYRWSQWLFLTLLEAGLVYRGSGNVDWCDTCQTTLATIQVEGGLCWRCHNPVRLIQRPQWNLRLSAYVEENDRRLHELENWDENSLASQRFVLGRVDGVEVDLPAPDGSTLTVFTPHAEALELARFVLISPKHPDIDDWAADAEVRERLEELRSGGLERSSRDAESIPLLDTGRSVGAPCGDGLLPVLISPVVDGRFGETAVLGIPEHDRTDSMIAERLAAQAGADGARATPPAAAVPRRGRLEAPPGGPLQGRRLLDLPPALVGNADPDRLLRGVRRGARARASSCRCCCRSTSRPPAPATRWRSRGSSSRPPVPAATGPRGARPTRSTAISTRYGCGSRCVYRHRREASRSRTSSRCADLRHWLPSERVVAGSDSGNFVFDQRIVTKALRDIGPLAFLADGEPFAGCLFHEMVIADGRKMSKHLGNVVDPDALVERYGADTVRLAVLYAARPQRSLNWSDSAVLRCHRFLTQVWEYSHLKLAEASADPERGRRERRVRETTASRSETRPSTSG